MALGQAVKTIVGVSLRLFLPVLALLSAYALSYVAQSAPIALFDNQALLGQSGLVPSRWLTAGHLAIMLALFVAMMTNRMFGPAYALLLIVASWIILAGIALFAWADVARLLHQTGTAQPDWHAALPFLGALAATHFVNIVLFDMMRGRPWWRAPLISGLGAALTLPIVYWTLGHEPGTPWIASLTLDIALKVVLVFALLALYALLRPITAPRDGFGGY